MIEQSAEIAFNRCINNDIRLMGLRSANIARDARPGQFVMIRVRDCIEPLLRRPFSITGLLEQNIILISYRIVGRGTAIMAELKEGQNLSVLGPLGNGFDMPEKERIPVLVAGGMGVAPLFFLAQSLRHRSVKFMAGFDSSKDIIPISIIGDLGIEMSISTEDGSKGHRGMVTELLGVCLKEQGQGKDSLSIFTCGPMPMVRAVVALASGQGVPCSVSLESHMACGVGACQGCAIHASLTQDRDYFHVCKDGPVFTAEAIEWKMPDKKKIWP